MIVINVLLYLCLLALVLAFNFASETSTTMNCGTAVADTTGENTRHIVSIVYAVLIAVVSLVLGLAFIVYGRKLLNQMVKASNAASKQRTLTRVCTLQWFIIPQIID